MSQRFFIYGYYGMGNYGDDLLLYTIINKLNDSIKGANYYIRNFGAIPILDKTAANITLTYIEKEISDKRHSKVVRVWNYLRAYWNYFSNCDYLIFGGGTLFHDRKSSSSLVILLIISIMAYIRNVKIIGIGLGISKLNSWKSRLILRSIVALCEEFCVRDQAALDECKKSQCQERVKLTSDLVFSLDKNEIFSKKDINIDVKRVSIGISLVDLEAFNWPNGTNLRKKYIDILSDFIIEKLKEEYNVILLSFQRLEMTDTKEIGDRKVLGDLQQKINQEIDINVPITDVFVSSSCLREQFKKIDFLIGMRYHGLITAALYGIPFIGLSHDNKVNDICSAYQMPCCDIGKIDLEWLNNTFSNSIKGEIDKKITAELASRANRNFKFLD